ncbi:hypothetical protein LPJ66_006935 [Kickxella alabastrina]|uniref:Uncharacterized protein n=1 Tax=Kickxella alabastrina TaxID=61397 RepID=A0ACC1IAC1_9FUNG|nr:hypothetical protein LPJ66_006935 [Kickxella alabastrina]
MSSHIPLPKDKHSKSKLYVTLSSLSSKKREHTKCIETHPFNYRLTILSTAPTLLPLLKSHLGSYYRVSMKLTDLINPDFIATYIKQNSLVALSLDNRLDTGDMFAVDGNGILVLSLCKDTYEELGLVGEAAQFPLERGARHIVRVDLRSDVMVPEKKYYQRVKKCFERKFTREVRFVVGWYDSETGGALNFDVPGAVECQPTFDKEHQLRDVWVPDVCDLQDVQETRNTAGSGSGVSDVWTERATDVFEWIGMASSAEAGAGVLQRILSANDGSSSSNDQDICTYSVPEPRKSLTLNSVSVSGLLSAKAISRLSAAALHHLAGQQQQEQQANSPLFLCVWGHEDAPVSWSASEHGFLTSGENMYAQVYNPNADKCTTFQACGPWDSHS